VKTIEKVYAKTWQELALHMVHQAKARYDAYEKDVRDWYEHGDGRSTRDGGRGHSYPYCIHGVSRWVDYDCACGSCEDGWGSYDYLRELEVAKEMAKDAFQTMQERIDLYVNLSNRARYENLPIVIDQAGWNEYVMAPVEMRK
jgi:hypothetical protein